MQEHLGLCKVLYPLSQSWPHCVSSGNSDQEFPAMSAVSVTTWATRMDVAMTVHSPVTRLFSFRGLCRPGG